MNKEQRQIFHEILLLIAASGKGQEINPRTESATVTSNQIKKESDKLIKIFDESLLKKLKNFFRGAPKTIINRNNNSMCRAESSDYLGRNIGAWCTQLPDWWYAKYTFGLFVGYTSLQEPSEKFYSARQVFTAIVNCLADSPSNLLAKVSFNDGNSLPLLEVLLKASIPPQLLTKLIVLENKAELYPKYIDALLRFMPLASLHKIQSSHPQNGFFPASEWLQCFMDARGVALIYLSPNADPFAEADATYTLDNTLNNFSRALCSGNQKEAINSLLELKRACEGFPPRLRESKFHLSALKSQQSEFMTLLKSTKLKEHHRWFLQHIYLKSPGEGEMTFTHASNISEFLQEKVRSENFRYLGQLLQEMPDWLRKIASYDLMKYLLKVPNQLLGLAKYAKEELSPIPLRQWLLWFDEAFKIDHEIKSRVFSRESLPDSNLVDLIDTCIDPSSKQLEEAYVQLKSYQTSSILWMVWLSATYEDKTIQNSLNELQGECKEWYREREKFLKNPRHSLLLDEYTAMTFLFSSELIFRIKNGDEGFVKQRLEDLSASLPEISESIASQFILFCPSFSMARMLLGKFNTKLPKNEFDIFILSYALRFDRVALVDEYLSGHNRDTIEAELGESQYFKQHLRDTLFYLSEDSCDLEQPRLSASLQKFSDVIKIGEDANPILAMMQTMMPDDWLALPMLEDWFFLLRGQMNLLDPEANKIYKENTINLPLKKPEQHLQTINAFYKIPWGTLTSLFSRAGHLYSAFSQAKTTAQKRRFLILILISINSIWRLPKDSRDLGGQHIFGKLVGFFFYQLHSLGFDTDIQLIQGIMDPELRSDFLAAHLRRLSYKGLNDVLYTLQRRSHESLDYSIGHGHCFDSNQNYVSAVMKLRDEPNYLMSQKFDFITYPCAQEDVFSLTLRGQVLSKGKYYNSDYKGEDLPLTFKADISKLTNDISTKKPSINISLAHYFSLFGELKPIEYMLNQNGHVFDSCGKKESLLKNAVLRYVLANTVPEKVQVENIISMLLDHGADPEQVIFFAEEKLKELGTESFSEAIKKYLPELYILLFRNQEEASLEGISSDESLPTSQELSDMAISEKIVAMVKQAYDSVTEKLGKAPKVSIRNVLNAVEKIGYDDKSTIHHFVERACLPQTQTLQNDRNRFFYCEQASEKTTSKDLLLGASYLKGALIIRNDNDFYPIRNSSYACFLYFNPLEIEGSYDGDAFRCVYEQPRIVTEHGAGIKHISGLKISVDGHPIERCFELKISNSKDRILGYLLSPDSDEEPPIYVACYYLKNGFHGRVRPSDLDIHIRKPLFTQSTASKNTSALI